MEEVAVGASIRQLPCEHAFHTRCIDRWLFHAQRGLARRCPLCNADPLLTPHHPGFGHCMGVGGGGVGGDSGGSVDGATIFTEVGSTSSPAGSTAFSYGGSVAAFSNYAPSSAAGSSSTPLSSPGRIRPDRATTPTTPSDADADAVSTAASASPPNLRQSSAAADDDDTAAATAEPQPESSFRQARTAARWAERRRVWAERRAWVWLVLAMPAGSAVCSLVSQCFSNEMLF